MTQSAYEKANAYKAHQQVQMDGREIDKRALLSCASRMKMAIDDAGKDLKLYQDALRHNQHLWTIFQVALSDPSNQMANDLKVTLLRLSGYVDQVSFKNITKFSEQALNSLININRTIAVGLGRKPEQAQPQDPSMAQGVMSPIAGTPASVMTSA